ncbi:MAG TPA: dihydrolipoyl dehydrogenase [Candidatus Binatia bacterium]|nr:dihydrolipoyl dehydrogenase [Candidatus Binatia bacterium]
MSDQSFDLVIIGSGPGGYVTAIRASQLGMKTAIVEREHLGGICLNWGCIPTKALLRASEIHHLLHCLDEFGFSAGTITFDTQKVVARSRAVAQRLSNGVRHLMKKNQVTVFDGHGRLDGDGRVVVEKGGSAPLGVHASHVILATGARPRSLPGIEPDGKLIWTYKEAMVPEAMPQSLLVIGSGAIGIEFASFYRNMGAEVTIVEVLPRILPVEDEEISALAHKAFAKQGMTIHAGASVQSLTKTADNVTAAIDLGGGKTTSVTVDRVILAVGITGNVENLGLDETGVTIEKGHIVVDEWLATGEPGVYAIGDVVGPPWLAHKASHEGIVCVEKIAGVSGVRPLDTSRIPGCTYCRPQIASVGLTEQQARDAGYALKVGRFPYVGNGKAIALGEADGLVKTIFDARTGELLGAHMIGSEVTELIQGFAIAKTLETTEAELIESIFPHPTLSETMHEAVLDAFGRVLHV